jgi:heat-inducible transcriptional repressor
VGSETVAERSDLGVSSATIRNELSALEELGFLSHPHTSAGRIPTDAGYRRYVDALPPRGRMRDAQRRAIAGFFAETMLDLEDVLKGTTQLLSRVTQYAGLAVPPSGSSELVARPS